MAMLTELVDVVVGVDTHKHTHTAAVVSAATGGVLDEATVGTEPDGFEALVAMAQHHGGLRAWAVEGSGSYGAGLTRFLRERGEWVVELDRPSRPARRNGAKSDSPDAVRAAREALAREHLSEPRAAGERAAVSVLLAARRSAVDGARVAQQQLHALVVAAPEPLRARFRGRSTRTMVTTAVRVRVDHRWDVESRATAEALRSLAWRARDLDAEARRLEQAITAIVRAWRPDVLGEFGVGGWAEKNSSGGSCAIKPTPGSRTNWPNWRRAPRTTFPCRDPGSRRHHAVHRPRDGPPSRHRCPS